MHKLFRSPALKQWTFAVALSLVALLMTLRPGMFTGEVTDISTGSTLDLTSSGSALSGATLSSSVSSEALSLTPLATLIASSNLSVTFLLTNTTTVGDDAVTDALRIIATDSAQEELSFARTLTRISSGLLLTLTPNTAFHPGQISLRLTYAPSRSVLKTLTEFFGLSQESSMTLFEGSLSLGNVIVILSFSAIVGFLTGVYPAYRASRLNPLDALRYK